MEIFPLSFIRIIGLLSSAAMLIFVISQLSRKLLRRGELIIEVMIVIILTSVSLFPSLLNGLTEIFSYQTRPSALAVIGVIVLFGLFLYMLREISDLRHAFSDLVRSLAIIEYHQTREKMGGMQPDYKIAIVMPAYNEEKNLDALLPALPSFICGLSAKAIVVLDGTKDRSKEVAQRHNIPVSVHPINRGQGDALRTGFDIAIAEGAMIIITMDADGQHRPEELEKIVYPIISDEADYVMGSRFLGEYEESGGARHFGIVFFSALISLLTGVKITDCTNGFRAIRTSGLAQMKLYESRFSAPELIITAANRGLRIKEVPVTILSRYEGESKKPRRWRYPLGFLIAIFKAWLRS